MNLDDLIAELERIRARHGNQTAYVYDADACRYRKVDRVVVMGSEVRVEA